VFVRSTPDLTGFLCRGKNQRNKGVSIINFAEEDDCLPSSSVAASSDRNSSGCGTAPKLDRDTVLLTLKDRLRELGQRLHEVKLLFHLCGICLYSFSWLHFRVSTYARMLKVQIMRFFFKCSIK
jgi:hypothetical protein